MTIKKKTPQSSPRISEDIGKLLALGQSKIDDIIELGFKKLGKVKKVPIRKTDTFAKKAVFLSIRFIADIGKSFYSEYKQLKKK